MCIYDDDDVNKWKPFKDLYTLDTFNMLEKHIKRSGLGDQIHTTYEYEFAYTFHT